MRRKAATTPVRTVRWTWALAFLLCLIGPGGRPAHSATPLLVGAVFSTAQSTSQSFLRFYNTGAAAGTVIVTLRDYASGQVLGQWTSPAIAAGAERQFPIGMIESEVGDFVKPSTYSISVQTAMSGYFQHVLYRPADGTLTNLSTCASGIIADPTKLSGVHSSIFSNAFPSSIAVNNTGTVALTPTLGLYDARDGTKLGVATLASVAAGGQAVFTVDAIEAAAGTTPPAGTLHYVVKAEGTLTGFLQHLVNNLQVGVVTDMTAACALDGNAPAAVQSPMRAGAVFSTAQAASQSFLRFYNAGTSAGAVTVTLNNEANGQTLRQWTSPSIPPGSEQQFSIGTIESGPGPTFAKPNYYAIKVQSGITGYFQHVLWRSADGTLTNLSTCGAGATASRTKLSGVHSSLFANSYPSTVVVSNTGASAAAVTLGVYDARDGSKRGTYTTNSIPANGQALLSMATIEAAVGAPTEDMYHYVIKAEGIFTGFLQHLVTNTKAGVVTDMTTACALGVEPPASTLSYAANAASARFGSTCQPGQTATDAFLLVCSSARRYRYALPEDMPAAPLGGYTARPAWYPPLSDIFRTSNPPACPASGRITLTHMIVPIDQLGPSTPQGAMIFDHVTPIDHGYIAIKSLNKPIAERTEADYVPVYAPANGEIIEISSLGSPTSTRIVIAHGCNTYTVIMVLNRLSGVLASYQSELTANGRVNRTIAVLAGQKIGEQRDNPLDFAVNDAAVWLRGYVAPASYTAEAWKPYTADPFPYFSPDLATTLEAVMRRTSPPRWGQIDQDIAGTAAGNWFLDGTVGYSGRTVEQLRTATQAIPGGPVAGKNNPSWSHLAIARYWFLPTQWVFSTGWWRDQNGDPGQWTLEIADGKPEPSDLTPDTGPVVYRLRVVPNYTDASTDFSLFTIGIVAIQVNADETLTIEPVPGVQDPAAFTGFTAAKRIYRR